MPLAYILRRVSSEAGYSNLVNNAAQHAVLIDRINEACDEIWDTCDLPGCLKEVTVKVPANKIIALPPFVGKPRAARETNYCNWKWPLRTLLPRYNDTNWSQRWNNFGMRGTGAIQRDVSNAAPPTLTIPVADSTVIHITGATAESMQITEDITMDAVTKVGTKSFTQYHSISKDNVNNYDVTVKDADTNELAILYNCFYNTRYTLLDVSQYPSWSSDCVDGSRLMDILYKDLLKRLENDGDAFPVEGFDNILIDKTLQLIMEKRGKTEEAVATDAKIQRSLNKKINAEEIGTEANMQFEPNPFYDLFGNVFATNQFGTSTGLEKDI